MVMNPTADSFDKLFRYQLEPEIYSKNMLQALLSYINSPNNQNSFKTSKTVIKIHLKIDTGMHRLGFEKQDITYLRTILGDENNAKKLQVQSIFTHLAAADGAEFNSFSHHQMQAFTEIATEIEQILGYTTIWHLCNSPAIVRFQDILHGDEHIIGISPRIADMVRLGIGLYGVETNGWLQDKLRTIATLKTVISQIKHIKAGETVGYSRKGKVEQDKTIATIAIGYADGFCRKFGNGAVFVNINGSLVPTIGNICMDMCMVDITNLLVQEGDEVIVFGENPTIFALAQQAETIPYEILTAVGERVKRVFVSE
jgi:alanine racemase